MKLAKVKLIITTVILLSLLATTIYSAYLTHEIPVGIKVVAADVKVYWDLAGNNLVAYIDYGEVNQGSQIIEKTLYVKNEGTGIVHVNWTSTLSQVTDKITEYWHNVDLNQPLNGSSIGAGDEHLTRYTIGLAEDVSLGSYNWTLTIWGTG